MSRAEGFPNTRFPSESRCIELMPGDVGLGLAGDQFKTLLGSCVSVILTDSRRTVGAMCHIVHVSEPGPREQGNAAYGRVAMAEMFRLLRGVGAVPALCQAFAYGGGNMFPGVFQRETVGDRNARWVMEYLAVQGINVVQADLRGVGHRTVSWTVGPAMPSVIQIPV